MSGERKTHAHGNSSSSVGDGVSNSNNNNNNSNSISNSSNNINHSNHNNSSSSVGRWTRWLVGWLDGFDAADCLRRVVRLDPTPAAATALMCVLSVLLLMWASVTELFPGSSTHGLSSSVSSSDGLFFLDAFALAPQKPHPKQQPQGGGEKEAERGAPSGEDDAVNPFSSVYGKSAVWDRPPLEPPALLTDEDLQELALDDLAAAQFEHAIDVAAANPHGRPLPRLRLPLAQYHTRLHLYILYTSHRDACLAHVERLQHRWGSAVVAREGTAAVAMQRALLEAEVRRVRFAALVQRTFMRAQRHADAMRLESLHFLRLFALTVPALSGLWKGDDFCRWAGVSCRVVPVPLYKLMDMHHPHLQDYSVDVFQRLPGEAQAAATARFDDLTQRGDHLNVEGRVRDEESGFAQLCRDMYLAQRQSSGEGGAMPAAELAEARLQAVATWHLLADNASGDGLPHRTWTQAVWHEYRSAPAGREPRSWLPPHYLGSARLNPTAQQNFLDEHSLLYEHPSLLLGRPPRVYYGSIEGAVSGAHRRQRGHTTRGRRTADPAFVTPFTAPSARFAKTRRLDGSVMPGGRIRRTEGNNRTTTATSSSSSAVASAMSNALGGRRLGTGSGANAPRPTQAAMDAALRELHEVLSDTRFPQYAGKGDRSSVDTVPVTVFSINVRDLGLTGALPVRMHASRDKTKTAAAAATTAREGETDGDDDDDLWGRGRVCDGWSSTCERDKLPGLFPSELLQALPVQLRGTTGDLLPSLETATETTTETEAAASLRQHLDVAAEHFGVAVSWRRMLQGEQARRAWVEEKRLRTLATVVADRDGAPYVIGPRSRSYWPSEGERPLSDVLARRSTVPGSGFDSAVATDLAAQLRVTATALEVFGLHRHHNDLMEYFGFTASLGHFGRDSESPMDAPPLHNDPRTLTNLRQWGLSLHLVEGVFFCATRIANPIRNVDDDALFGVFEPRLVALLELDISRNPHISGNVPAHYFRFPVLRGIDVSNTAVLFRIANRRARDTIASSPRAVAAGSNPLHRKHPAVFAESSGSPYVNAASHYPQQQTDTALRRRTFRIENGRRDTGQQQQQQQQRAVFAGNNDDLAVTVEEAAVVLRQRGTWAGVWERTCRLLRLDALEALLLFRIPLF